MEPDEECSICSSECTEDEGMIQGYIGILPVTFCSTCYCGIEDMFGQMDGSTEYINELEEQIEGLR